jgi:hypothetical protein
MGSQWEERGYDTDARKGMAALGLVLIVLGGLFLLSEQIHIDWGGRGWPLYVIVPGVVLLVLGLAIPNEAGLGMAIPGGIITAVGLLLAYQEYNDAYASWAYAWTLVAPGSVGVSMTLYGLLHRRGDLLEDGLRTATIGLGLFVGFGLFFVNVIRIHGGNEPELLKRGFPILAIVLGVLIVIINLLPQSRASGGAPASSDAWVAGPGSDEAPK